MTCRCRLSLGSSRFLTPWRPSGSAGRKKKRSGVLTLDDSEWEAAVDEWIVLAAEQGRSANHDGAESIQRVSRQLLDRWHPPFTATPSAPGEPPASISGTLAASFIVTDDADSSEIGPTTVYGREQELGGPMEGHPYMNFFWEGRWWHKRFIDLAPGVGRPTLKPATEEVIDSGELTRIYYAHWLIAQNMVTG
jgi:hypothetical protein